MTSKCKKSPWETIGPNVPTLVLFVACLSEVSNQAQAQLKVGKVRGGAHWFCYVVTGHWFIFLAILSFYSEYKAIPHILHGKFKQYDDEFVLKNTYILTKIIFILPWNFSYYQDIGKVLRQRS